MLEYILLVNKQGQTRLSKYYVHIEAKERIPMEAEIVRKCLGRSSGHCSFMEYRDYKVVYKRYASLFFIVAVDNDENELAILEFIHCYVQTLDLYFSNVCELDIMFNIDKVHWLLDEMVLSGEILETNKTILLAQMDLSDEASERDKAVK